MEKEFNLWEKSLDGDVWSNWSDESVYLESDIKEFIRLLKEPYKDFFIGDDMIGDLLRSIDKLAGEKFK